MKKIIELGKVDGTWIPPEPKKSVEFYALEACRMLMKAEEMQQGLRGGWVMGTISLAIDAARDAIKESDNENNYS